MVRHYLWDENLGLPMVYEAETGENTPDRLMAWRMENKGQLDKMLLKYGALLFRGFGVNSRDRFESFLESTGETPHAYQDGNSPRTKLSSTVYTSTEYPAQYSISMHNELSYAARWPEKLYFCCVTEPEEDGCTPIGNSRALLKKLDPAIVARYCGDGVKYTRCLHGGHGFGPSWQKTYETEDKAEVEAFLKRDQTEFVWQKDGSLLVTQTRPAVAVHPQTGERVWFNQADQFHPSNNPKQIYESLAMIYKGREDQIPQNAFFGKGEPIEDAILDEVRRVAGEVSAAVPWRQGDLLVIDNMLTCHGRQPYKGPRKILVSMTGAINQHGLD